MQGNKCKICRRAGVKLFLRGERCFSTKCAMIKRPYPPGKRIKKRKSLSEYGKELKEKQKLKNWYNLSEEQFSKYVKKALGKRGKVEDARTFLMKELESRFDNVIFKLGWASSRSQARQMVSHQHFLVNGKKINIPSYRLKKGDKITIHPSSMKLDIFQKLPAALKKYQFPSWLELNLEKLEGKIKEEPLMDESDFPAEISIIFEYYSR
ncbi:MAG: 30S ribosomal protein S4 [Minisyncoccales bacterium]